METISLEILKGYLTNTCNDPTVLNKYLNILNSYHHKEQGAIVTSRGTTTTDIFINFSDGTQLLLPKPKTSEQIAFIDGLQPALNNKVNIVPGKQLSTEDYTTTEKNKLSGLQNYVHPDSHTISEISGLELALQGKAPISEIDRANESIGSVEQYGSVGLLSYNQTDVDDTFTNVDAVLDLYPQSFFMIYLNETSNVYFAIRKAESSLDLTNCEIQVRGGGAFITDDDDRKNAVNKIKVLALDPANSTATYDLYELDYTLPLAEINRYDHDGSYYFTFYRLKDEIGGDTGVPVSDNPNVFIPSTVSDFTGATSARANKIWSIREAFDLTAGNFTVPQNVILSFDGGSIKTTGSINFADTKIISDNYKQIFDVGDVSGAIKGNVVANWFGLVGDGVTDNRNSLMITAKLVNASGGTAYVYNDTDYIYASSVVLNTTLNMDMPSNIVITGIGTSWIGVSNQYGQPKFKILGHNFSGSELFATFKTQGGVFENIGIIGERDEHTYSGVPGADERNHNFVIGIGTRDFTVKKCSFSQSEADGVYYINHYNISNVHSTLDYTQGNISYADGAVEVDEGYMYSNLLFPITDSVFTDINKFSVKGGSYGTLFNPRIFHAVYYDATNNFLGKSDVLSWYDEVIIPANCTQVRIVLPYTSDDFEVTVSAPYISQYTEIINCTFKDNSRQHISNPGQNAKLLYNTFGKVGEKSPARAIDIEDAKNGSRYIEIAYNTFQNAHNGDIITKNCEYLNFHDNVLLPNDEYAFTDGNSAQTEGTGINVLKGYYTQINNNVMHDRTLSIGDGGTASNNVIREGKIVIGNKNTTVEGGQYYNVTIDNRSEPDWLEGRSYIKNAKFFFDKPFDDHIFRHKRGLVIENTVFDFQNKIKYDGSTKLTYEDSNVTGFGVNRGFFKNVVIQNIEVEDTFKYFHGLEIYAHSVWGLISSVPLDVRRGDPQDLIFRDMQIKGRVRLRLEDYTSTGLSFKEVYFDNLFLDVDHADYDASSAYPFAMEQKDVDVYVKNSKVTTVAGIAKILWLKNTGIKVFENVTFESADALTIDLNIVASGGAVTFKDCKFSSNITLVLRAGDTNISGGGSGSSSLAGLSDVSSATPTDKFALVANGSSYSGRQLAKADLSDATNIYDKSINQTVTKDMTFNNGLGVSNAILMQSTFGDGYQGSINMVNSQLYLGYKNITTNAKNDLRLTASTFEPVVNQSSDIGTTTRRWKDLYLGGQIYGSKYGSLEWDKSVELLRTPVLNSAALKFLAQSTLFDGEMRIVKVESKLYWYHATESGAADPTWYAPDDQVGATGYWKPL